MPLSDYLPQSTDLPDQFEPEETGHPFTFPCNCCAHNLRPHRECEGCAHYA